MRTFLAPAAPEDLGPAPAALAHVVLARGFLVIKAEWRLSLKAVFQIRFIFMWIRIHFQE